MVAVATVLAYWGHWYLEGLAWVHEHQAKAMARVTAVAMVMVIVCDVRKRMKNAMETLRLSFRRYKAGR